MAKSSRKKATNKPAKPSPDFALFPHASGRWSKKIRGRLEYFGRWGHKQGDEVVALDDVAASAAAALEVYLSQSDDLEAGRVPRPPEDRGITLQQLSNRFLTAKKHRLDTGELSPRTFKDYLEICVAVCDFFGKTRAVADLNPDDFISLRSICAESHGAHRLAKDIRVTRMLFGFGMKNGLVEKIIQFGTEFVEPGKKAKREKRAVHTVARTSAPTRSG